MLLFGVPIGEKQVCSLVKRKLQAKLSQLGCPVTCSRIGGNVYISSFIHLKILKSWSISESPGNSGLLTKQEILRRKPKQMIMTTIMITTITIMTIKIITWSTSLLQYIRGSKCRRCTSKTLTQAEFQEPCTIYKY